jgi:hypothetical protein
MVKLWAWIGDKQNWKQTKRSLIPTYLLYLSLLLDWQTYKKNARRQHSYIDQRQWHTYHTQDKERHCMFALSFDKFLPPFFWGGGGLTSAFFGRASLSKIIYVRAAGSLWPLFWGWVGLENFTCLNTRKRMHPENGMYASWPKINRE